MLNRKRKKSDFSNGYLASKNKKRREVKKVEKAEFGDPYEEDLAPVEEK